jgi:hypothetical protein
MQDNFPDVETMGYNIIIFIPQLKQRVTISVIPTALDK